MKPFTAVTPLFAKGDINNQKQTHKHTNKTEPNQQMLQQSTRVAVTEHSQN